MNLADSIAKTLKAYDTRWFFLLTGGDESLWFSLEDEGISFALCRSEQASTYMADGYARISYKPGFVYGQSGPGAANVAAALADGFWAYSPIVAITSSTSSREVYRDEYQEINQLPMFEPVTKWNGIVPEVSRVPDLLRTAIRTAVSGVPRPTHLDVPNNYFELEVGEQETYAEEEYKGYPALRTAPEASKVADASHLISIAERPVIVAGSGVILSKAWDELITLAELMSIPVATSLGGKGSIPENHPLSIGVMGKYSRKSANEIVRRSDLVFFVGSNASGWVTDSHTMPDKGARIIHNDTMPDEIGRNLKVEVPLLGDAKLVLRAISDHLREKGISRPPGLWVEEIRKISTNWRSALREVTENPSSPLNPQKALKVLREILGKDDIVVADTGYMAAWTAALFDTMSPGRTYIRAAGSLGWALPASIGAKIAAPEKNVVCVIGDGGFGFHVAELETAKRLGKAVVVLLLNNSMLAEEYQYQKYLYGRIVKEVTEFRSIDFAKLASAFGVEGRQVQNEGDLRTALKESIDCDRPTVLDVVIGGEDIAPVSHFERLFERNV